MGETESIASGGASRRRLDRRLLAVVVLVVAGTAMFVGGFVAGRTTGTSGARAISDADHDRLVDACVAETGSAPGCVQWIADLLRWAEAQDMTYAEVAELMVEGLDAADRQSAEAAEQHSMARLRELCEWVNSLRAESPTTRLDSSAVCEAMNGDP